MSKTWYHYTLRTNVFQPRQQQSLTIPSLSAQHTHQKHALLSSPSPEKTPQDRSETQATPENTRPGTQMVGWPRHDAARASPPEKRHPCCCQHLPDLPLSLQLQLLPRVPTHKLPSRYPPPLLLRDALVGAVPCNPTRRYLFAPLRLSCPPPCPHTAHSSY